MKLENLEPHVFYEVRMEFKDGICTESIRRAEPAPKPIGPLFLCPFHDYEQFESGPCPDCYDDGDYYE